MRWYDIYWPRRLPSNMSREAAIHTRPRHANIVSMIGVVLDLDNQGFVLEYVKFRSFTNFLEMIKDENGVFGVIGV